MSDRTRGRRPFGPTYLRYLTFLPTIQDEFEVTVWSARVPRGEPADALEDKGLGPLLETPDEGHVLVDVYLEQQRWFVSERAWRLGLEEEALSLRNASKRRKEHLLDRGFRRRRGGGGVPLIVLIARGHNGEHHVHSILRLGMKGQVVGIWDCTVFNLPPLTIMWHPLG